MAQASDRTSKYLFDNSAPETRARFGGLAALYDESSTRHLAARGVGDGWYCLDVGSGGGSIALWLCEAVGPSGRVLATDIDTRYLEQLAHPRLEVQRHDITRDPLPADTFDLIHTRLVLVWLPEREAVIERLAAALKPGGWLVLEEFDGASIRPEPEMYPLEHSLQANVVMRQVLEARGNVGTSARRLNAVLEGCGLVDVDQEGRLLMWRGGSAGADLLRANFNQIRGAMLETGAINEAELDADLARLDDPNFVMPAPIMWTAWGRRPG